MLLAFGREHERRATFDRLVETTHIVLENPAVVDALGTETTERLQVVADGLYMPAVRDGQAFLPDPAFDFEGRVALLPFFEDEAARAISMTRPLREQTILEPEQLPERMFSEAHGSVIDVSKALTKITPWNTWRRNHGQLIEQPTPLSRPRLESSHAGIQSSAAAATKASWQYDTDRLAAQRSEPVIIVRDAYGSPDALLAGAAITTHELAHAEYMQRLGIISCTPSGAVSHELYGYDASGSVLEGYLDPEELAGSVHRKLEDIRAQYPSPYPYAVTDQQMFNAVLDLNVL